MEEVAHPGSGDAPCGSRGEASVGATAALADVLDMAEAGSLELDIEIALLSGYAERDEAGNLFTRDRETGGRCYSGSGDPSVIIRKFSRSLDAIVDLVNEKQPSLVLDIVHEAQESLCTGGWYEDRPLGPQLAMKIAAVFVRELSRQD